MEFEWDNAKADANLKKHGIDFVVGAEVFSAPVVLTIVDTRFAEARFRTIGMVNGIALCVASTMRGGICRIISVRRASRAERRFYDSL